MLTHVDICTALWDSALGHISCNDENDDGDEASGRGVGGGGSGIFYFLPLSILQYQSVQWDKMEDNGCSQKRVDRITSFVWTLDTFIFTVLEKHPVCSTHKLLLVLFSIRFEFWTAVLFLSHLSHFGFTFKPVLHEHCVLIRRQEVRNLPEQNCIFLTSVLTRRNVFLSINIWEGTREDKHIQGKREGVWLLD